MTTSERRTRAGLAAAIVLVLSSAAAAAAAAWLRADPAYAWTFPRDHWPHEGYRTEWWYFTGQLVADEDPERRFAYQFTVFKVGLAPQAPPTGSAWTARNLWMGHAAVGDLHEGRHAFSEVLWREIPLLARFAAPPDARIAWARAPAGSEGVWTLGWNGRGFDLSMRDDARGIALELSTQSVKDVVLHGPNGWSRKSPDAGAASLYYSLTRLATVGTLRSGGRTWRVRGESWMDKEFSSSLLGPDQVGWDWISLRLADGRDLMLYALRRRDGTADWRSATLVPASGPARDLPPEAWAVRATRSWSSPASGAVYPSRWVVEVPSERIRVELVPDLADQENRSAAAGGIVYWEGSVSALDSAGSKVGEGYVELTGYAPGSRPPM